MSYQRYPSPRLSTSVLLAFGLLQPLGAKYIGGQAPKPGCSCASSSCSVPSVREHSNTSSQMSRTQGNLVETVPITKVRSGFGPTIDLSFVYNSQDANNLEDSRKTVSGYGWTHSYNIFLFGQLGAMFRYDGDGRVTRYAIGSGGGYTTPHGYFDTLAKTGATTFTITTKDKTVYSFAYIPNTPFTVGGPVYRLTTIVNRNGNTTTLTYNSSGDLSQISDTYLRTVTFTYNAHLITAVKDPLGRTTTFAYDSTNSQLTQITDPNGNSIRYTYDTQYEMTSKKDKAGRTFTYSYSSSDPTAIYDSNHTAPATLSNSNNWATDATQLAQNQLQVYLPSTATTTDGLGHTWRYQYDSNGYMIQEKDPDGATTSYTYDPSTLQLASMTDASGHTTSYAYDPQGERTQWTDPLGNVTKYTYDPVFNTIASMTDSRSRVTNYTIDAHGNRITETDPLGNTSQWAYDAHGNLTSHLDKNGNQTTYQYDTSGNLTQKTEAFGTAIQSTTHYSYDAEGNLIQMTDALGRVTQYHYDGMDRLTQETDAVGTPVQRTIQTVYDGEGNRTQVIDGRGITTQYTYDVRQRLITETDAVGTPQQRTTTTTYDADDNRITTADPLGRVTKYVYDTRNRVIQETDATGTPVQATTHTAYDSVGNIVGVTDGDGHTTTYTYDALNRRITMTDPLSEQTLYFYDGGTFSGSVTVGGQTVTCNQCGATPGSSLVTGQVDPDGTASLHAGTTYMFYDALDRLVIGERKTGCIAGPTGSGCPNSINTANDAVSLYTYDAVGNRLTRTEPDGNTTATQYDARNRLIQDTNAAGDVTSTTYDSVNNPLTITAPNLNVTTSTYDALNRVVQVTDSIGLVTTTTYDADNNRISRGDGDGHIANYTYDALNRVTTSTDPLGKSDITHYDSVGNVLSVTDRNGNTTNYTYDALNRRSSMTDALGNNTAWQYDSVGNLVELTDANLHSTQYSYDAVNRPHCETYADGTKRCYTYDAAGNMLERQDAISGQTVTYSYDDLYFLTERLYAPSGANDTFQYDLSGRMVTNERANSTFTWTESFTYDGADRLTQSIQDGQTITYSYNIPGRTRSVTYPGGSTITEYTDARSRMDHINSTPSVQYTYDLADKMLGRSYKNGTSSSYSYNADNWTMSVTHSNGGGPFAAFSYAYDNEGNKQYEQKAPNTPQSECYSYDATYRLTGYGSGTMGSPTPCPVIAPPTPPTQTSYSLDPVGNWNSKTTNAVTQTRLHNSVNEITQINSTTLSYDNDGDLTNDGVFAYQYDEEHRLTSVTRIADSVVVGQYQYDALSRRTEKIANPTGSASTTTLYFYDDARIVEEQNTAAITQATYVYGNYIDEILTMDRGGQTYYYHQNALWSVEAVTDSSGNPVERYDFCGGGTLACGDAYGAVSITDGSFNPVPANSWGTPHSAIGNPWMFTGRELDEETGLYDYRARYYDPAKGRFLQRDPKEYVDGLNLYEYSRSNPLTYVDPSGNDGEVKIKGQSQNH